jgi:Ca2+-binding EF-hand superfamily protein
MKNKGLTIADIAYKMDFDLYNRALSECLNTNLDKLSFQVKMKLVNDNYDNEFLSGLFKSIANGKNQISMEKIFEMFNYNNDTSFRHLSEIKNEISNMCLEIIPKCVSYTELKNNFNSLDKQVLGLITLENFLNVMKKYIGSKISSENLLHFIRMNKLMNNKNMINYRNFLMIIYIECKDDTWVKCLKAFRHFLKKECNDDLFIFIVKINNMCNNTSIKKTIEIERMHEFLKRKTDNNLDICSVFKFDFDKDAHINLDDFKHEFIV